MLRAKIEGGYLKDRIVPHPLFGMIRRLHIRLVEHQNERQLGFVQNTACIEHVGHECRRVCGPRRVHDIDLHKAFQYGDRTKVCPRKTHNDSWYR